MSEGAESCQYYYGDFLEQTMPDDRVALPLRRYWWNLKRYVWYISVLGFTRFAKKMLRNMGSTGPSRRKKRGSSTSAVSDLNLQPGDYVEVRSLKEIFATLDSDGKLKGLRFTPEMVKFCGKRFKVYKKLKKIILEATGELRRIKTPTVILEEVFCDGKAHGGCDRCCFCYWREAWLRRAPTPKES